MAKKKAAPTKLPPQGEKVDQTYRKSHPKGPAFRPTTKWQERHRQPLYCITWSNDIHVDEKGRKFRYLATCGSKQTTIYEVEVDKPKGSFDLKQSYRDQDQDEYFYACVYGGRSRYWGAKHISGNSTNGECDALDDSENSNTCKAGQKRQYRDSSESLILESNGTREANYLTSKALDGPQLLCVAGAGSMVKIIDPVHRRQVGTLQSHGSDIYDLKISPTNEMLLLSASVDESIRLWNLESFACVSIFAGEFVV